MLLSILWASQIHFKVVDYHKMSFEEKNKLFNTYDHIDYESAGVTSYTVVSFENDSEVYVMQMYHFLDKHISKIKEIYEQKWKKKTLYYVMTGDDEKQLEFLTTNGITYTMP